MLLKELTYISNISNQLALMLFCFGASVTFSLNIWKSIQELYDILKWLKAVLLKYLKIKYIILSEILYHRHINNYIMKQETAPI